MLLLFTLNIRLAEPQLIVNPTKYLRGRMVGYMKTVLVDAATVDRARELAVATVDDGTVKESNYRSCAPDLLHPAVAEALAAAEPGPERVVVLPGLIYYRNSSERSWWRRLRIWLGR